MQNRFSLTPESARHPLGVSLRRFLCPRPLGEIPQQVVRGQIVVNPPEETMKIRLVVALAGLAIGFNLPTFAQQKDTVDPKIVEQLREEDKNFEEAYNKHDAAAIAALFTDDAVLVTPHGTFTGRAAIEKNTRKKISRHTMAATWSLR